MKHEALTDAISMLDDELLAEAQEPFLKRRIAPSAIKICAAAAAVCALLMIPRGGGADILIMGKDPSDNPVAIRTEVDEAVAIRAFAMECTEIPVEVVSSEKTVISVSSGDIFIIGEGTDTVPAETPLELNGSASLMWSIPLCDTSEEFRLTAQTEKNCHTLLLSFDEILQEWTVQEIAAV